LKILPATLPCTQGSDGGWQFLDHFAVRLAPSELPSAARATVYGACAETSCGESPSSHVIERLSDHCPLVINLLDRDDD
jgi:hypothetical protein